MTIKPNVVRLFNAALDDAHDSPAGVVIRGALDLGTLGNTLVDDYQREVAPLSSQEHIIEGLKSGTRLPDVDLAMRGTDFTIRDGNVILKDPVFRVDGNQRISTIITFIQMNPGAQVRIGATVHLNTTKEWERQRFHKLNNWRSKVSPNITLRNMREDNTGIHMLINLSQNDKSFPLVGRVSWRQKMLRTEMINARSFVWVINALHVHKVGMGSTVDELGASMKKLVENIGMQTARDNVRGFFGLIDECWGIKAVQYREGAIYMRNCFLWVLARVLSDHHDFWTDDAEKKLFINVDLRRKIAQFPINDPEIMRLAGSSGKARQILYILLRDHINKGKTTKRLKQRAGIDSFDDEEEKGGDE